MSEQEGSKCAKCPLAMRIINICSALLLIGFGIAGLILTSLNSLSSGKFFLLFSPIFMIIVGFLFIGAQFSFKFIIDNFTFLRTYVGRGVFNIFMASSVFYYFSCGSNNEVVGWIAAILIFLLGLFYIVIHFCGGKAFEKQTQKKQGKQQMISS